jgi:predicted aminopeptidase
MYLRAVPLFVLFLLTGCATIDYYAQTVTGHFQLMGRSRSMAELIADPATDEGLRQRLELVSAIRDYASSHLQLPENESYRSYADLQREAVVWSVAATGEFSVLPRQWCYPFVGCASYRGYFSNARAEKYAASLQMEGMDAAVEPVPAYSTLGWFDDPLPSTVVQWPEALLAGLIFHELAHQRLYVPGDSEFNEAFATTVERVGVERWFRDRGDAEGERAWRRMDRREGEFVELVLETRRRLQQLYTRQLSPAAMRAAKAAEFDRLKGEYARRRGAWGNNPGLDRWFGRELNNAHLALIATYEQWVPALRELLRREGGDLRRFYQACDELALLSREEREQRLRQLMASAPLPVRSAGATPNSVSSPTAP